MKQFKVLSVILFTWLLFCVSAGGVAAEETQECTTTTGSYGQTNTVCKVLGVTHQPVAAGVGEVSFLAIAGLCVLLAIGAFGLARVAERTYWLD